MSGVQLYFAIGVPTFSVLVGIVVGLFQSNHVLNQLKLRLISIESRIGSLESNVSHSFALLEADMKILVRLHNDLDVRLA